MLVALVLGAVSWIGGAPSAPASTAEPAGRGDARLVNEDGTVGPVVALGDSLTSAEPVGGTDAASWFVVALAAETRLLQAANAGIPGDTTEGMVERFARDVAVHEPRVVVILGGTNDLGRGRTTGEVVGDLERLAREAREAGAAPVLATIPPRVDQWFAKEVGELNAAIRASAAASGTPVIDFHSALSDGDGNWLPGFTEDGVHTTAAAAEAMAEVALRTLFQG
ncbi:Lysophospholipase L1 [Blastococcus fimeti]|nr:Lysophospholipase L1 [Blastococcus fimeti]